MDDQDDPNDLGMNGFGAKVLRFWKENHPSTVRQIPQEELLAMARGAGQQAMRMFEQLTNQRVPIETALELVHEDLLTPPVRDLRRQAREDKEAGSG